MADRRLRTKSMPAASKFPQDYSHIMLCFVFEKAHKDEHYVVVGFNSTYLKINEKEKLSLTLGDRVQLHMEQRIFFARFVCRGDSKLINRASNIIDSIVSDCENTDEILQQISAKLEKAEDSVISPTAASAYDQQEFTSDSEEEPVAKRSNRLESECQAVMRKKVAAEAHVFSRNLGVVEQSAAASSSSSCMKGIQQANLTQESMDVLKDFIRNELRGLERRLLHNIQRSSRPTEDNRVLLKPFDDEEFQTTSGVLVHMSTITSDNPSKFLRDYIRLRFGPEYFTSFVIDSRCGNRTRRAMAPDDHVDEMKRLLRKCYHISAERFPSLWQELKNNLNQIARESKRRRKGAT